MSNRPADITGVKFEPVLEQEARTPGEGLLILGVIFPAVVILLELTAQICAQTFFDPMPTWWHVLAVCFVPASNLLVWMHLRNSWPYNVKWLALANGGAIAIGAFYTIIFVPLLPLAIIGFLFVIGLPPLAPLATFVSALRLRTSLRKRHKNQALTRPLVGGLLAGLTLLLALDLPAATTRIGIQWARSGEDTQRERGLTLLRSLGDDDLLLRLCYGAAGKPTGLLSALVMYSGGFNGRPRPIAVTQAEAREIYYRVHGVPFSVKPAPFEHGKWARVGEFQADNDHGGTQVGGRLKGLHLVASRLDGSVSGDDAVAYLEWTVEFRNTEPMDREARVQFALPPGGVVSRATLWVNGEEREAAYGERGAVRAAYQKVAVQQRRDPLLVTTKGADRVLAQAFPVPRNGGTIKFKLGISAPLDVIDSGKARFALPAIVDRNFSFQPNVIHSVWIESKQPLAISAKGLTAGRTPFGPFRISGSLGDRDLSGTRQVITVDRNADTGRLASRLGEGVPVVQEIAPSHSKPAGALILVIDGSSRLASTTTPLLKALDTIPSNLPVGVIIAAEPMQLVAPAPWSNDQRRKVVALLRSTSFHGGQDNAPALAKAAGMLEAEPHATLLWIHGPQPVSFSAGAAQLEQASARLARLPQVVLYNIEPGPNELLPDAPWTWGARSLPQTGSLESDLSAFFARISGQTPVLAIRRGPDHDAAGLARGSDHIARLWAKDHVLELMRADPTGNRAAAVALASQYRLVTPVSGAVVLENHQQYRQNQLTPVEKATVPTVPEPHEWALAIITCASLMWLAWRNRQRFAAVA